MPELLGDAPLVRQTLSEDQAFLIDFLIDNNNEYNRIKISKQDFLRASAARRNCAGGSIARDSELSASLHQGKVPVLTSQDTPRIRENLESKGLTIQPIGGAEEKPSGYVAVGIFNAADKTFRNFMVPAGSVNDRGSIAESTIRVG